MNKVAAAVVEGLEDDRHVFVDEFRDGTNIYSKKHHETSKTLQSLLVTTVSSHKNTISITGLGFVGVADSLSLGGHFARGNYRSRSNVG